ncbi:MAG: hypothetical protein ISP01_04335 [Methanobrevibacter arboriphilus]|uniref:protein adenylyltransferase n=1 Tax=Methanobrevibacter arboriphilus TaxID=39441 RepID=A0A843AFR0_METAZ|nr:hypothetical protein [Methanobrevibacter arboriphilus]MBF4468611.1 hypothetical protein [Methanobrevibacter arboriphilus]
MSLQEKKYVQSLKKDALKNFKEEYNSLFFDYELMGKNIVLSLRKLLDDNEINYLDVQSRIKDWDSILNKIERKNYTEPSNQIEDICGIRIICYYASDIKKVEDMVRYEFNIESWNKHEPEHDEFKYNLPHYIIKLKDNWLETPLFRDYEGLKAEIQIGTVLMHGWTNISHEIYYKNENLRTKEEKRALSRTNAMLEEVDKKFVEFREFHEQTNDSEIKNFDFNQELKTSALSEFLKIIFPDKKSISNSIENVWGWISILNENDEIDIEINFSSLNEAIQESEGVVVYEEKIEDKKYDRGEFLERILYYQYPEFADID